MELALSQGCPETFEGRQENEIRVYELLDSLDIRYDRVDHEPAETMEACAKVDEVLKPAVICKNLFLCNTQKTNFYLLMIKEDKKFKTKEISKQINSPRLSFAPSEYMEEYLDIKPGAVSSGGKYRGGASVVPGKNVGRRYDCHQRLQRLCDGGSFYRPGAVPVSVFGSARADGAWICFPQHGV
jgi:hypothetical protein